MKPLTIQSLHSIAHEESLLYYARVLTESVRKIKRKIFTLELAPAAPRAFNYVVKFYFANRAITKLQRELNFTLNQWDALTYEMEENSAREEQMALAEASVKFKVILEKMYKMPKVVGTNNLIAKTRDVSSKIDQLLLLYNEMFSSYEVYTPQELAEMDAYWEKYKKQNPEHFKLLAQDRSGPAYFHKRA